MPNYEPLIRLLVTAPQRVSAAGEIQLTPAEAAMLRAAGFLAATAVGRWQIPALPPHYLRCSPWLERFTPGRPATAMPEARADDHATSGSAASLVPASEQRVAAESDKPPRSRFGVDPKTRLRWLVATTTSDQRRILTSLLRRPDALVERRRFQRALHRLKPPAFNAALTRLIAARLVTRVTRDGVGCLYLPPDIRGLLSEAGIGVRRRVTARALATRTETGARRARRHRKRHDSHGRRGRRPVPNRRRQPREWGLSQLARRGGLARQAQCRAAGVCPTDAATRARLAKRERLKNTAQEVQTAASGASSNFGASWPLPAQQVRDESAVRSSANNTASRLLHAWESLRQLPIGRAERLAAERNRR